MNDLSPIGHNNPPDPIDEVIAAHDALLVEAPNWLDGGRVENDAQAAAVEALIKQAKAFKSDVSKAEKSDTAPLHDAWKKKKARWKPIVDDAKRITDGLTALVGAWRIKQREEAEAKLRAKRAEADRKAREAEEARRKADAADIEAQREADALAQEAAEQRKAASKAQAAVKDVKGLRTVWHFEVTDRRDLLNWIARNDPQALEAFITEYARRNHREKQMAGVRSWSTKEPF
jgi:DNA repair exonuclease SbcCD ATPase subunit